MTLTFDRRREHRPARQSVNRLRIRSGRSVGSGLVGVSDGAASKTTFPVSRSDRRWRFFARCCTLRAGLSDLEWSRIVPSGRPLNALRLRWTWDEIIN
jgi:hypothetical protein